MASRESPTAAVARTELTALVADWGAAVVSRLAPELKNELPEIKGFSERNIDRMIAFHRTYPIPADSSPLSVAKSARPEKTDAQTSGLLLCQTRDRLLAEYSFAGIDQSIGISTYELTQALPARLPTVEQIETELSGKPLRSAKVGRKKP